MAVPEGGAQVMGRGPSTASFAMGAKVASAPALLVASTGRELGRFSNGGVVSRTLTFHITDRVLPFPSEAVQLTGVDPKGKSAPEAGVQTTGIEAPPSVATGVG